MNVPPNDDTASQVKALVSMATDVTDILDSIAFIKGYGYASALNSMFNIQTGFSVCIGLMGAPSDPREQKAVMMVHRLGVATVQHAAQAFVTCLVPDVPATAFDDEKQAVVAKRNKLLGEMIDDMKILFDKHDQYVPTGEPG